MLIRHQFLRLASHQQQFPHELSIPLQFLEIGVKCSQILLVLCSTEQVNPTCAVLVRFFVGACPKLIEIVDFIQVADVIANLSQIGHLQIPKSLLPVFLEIQLDVHRLFEVRNNPEQLLQLQAHLSFLNVVHGFWIFYFGVGEILHREVRCKPAVVPPDLWLFLVVFAVLLRLEQQQCFDERMREDLRTPAVAFLRAAFLEKVG